MTRPRQKLALALALLVLVAPASVAAKGPAGTVLPGQSAVIWSNPNATGTDQIAKGVLSSVSGPVALAGGTVNGGCEYKTFNAFGWVMTRYTLYQTFKYDGTKITYFPNGAKSTEANWEWYDNGSQDPVKHWMVNPKSGYSIGNYAFRRDVFDYHETHNGTVKMDIRGTGAWWCSVT